MKRHQLSGLQGKDSIVYFERIGQNLWMHWKGQTYSFELEKRRKASSGQSSAASGDVVSPMPGKILKVLVQKGQKVTADQTLVVMEAMKMEYSLKSGREGTIKKVCYAEGDQVTAGKLLVELESEDESQD